MLVISYHGLISAATTFPKDPGFMQPAFPEKSIISTEVFAADNRSSFELKSPYFCIEQIRLLSMIIVIGSGIRAKNNLHTCLPALFQILSMELYAHPGFFQRLRCQSAGCSHLNPICPMGMICKAPDQSYQISGIHFCPYFTKKQIPISSLKLSNIYRKKRC